MLGWTRRGVGASERAVQWGAGKTYMSYTKDERAGVGGGNGRRAGERARLRLRAVEGSESETVHGVLAVVEDRIIVCNRGRRRRRRGARGGRRIIQQDASAVEIPLSGGLVDERWQAVGRILSRCSCLPRTAH